VIRKITLNAVIGILFPLVAHAGSYSIAVTSGSVSGTVVPAPLSGYAATTKTFTATAAATYTLSNVTRNGSDITNKTAYVNGSGPWTVTVPLTSTSQTLYVSFKKIVQATPSLTALLPAGVTIPVNTPTPVSGAGSTIANLQAGTRATFTFSGSSLTFSPVTGQVTNPVNISTNVTAESSGTYTGTLTLTAPGATPSSANVIITVQPPGVTASSYCLNCHNGWDEANKYAASPHATSSKGPSCQSCHNPGLALQHPGYSTLDTQANPGIFYSCVTCHHPGSTIVTAWPPTGLSFHNSYNGTNRCMQCHNAHTTAATACDACHDCPPATGSHLKHYGGTIAQARYGDISLTQTFGNNTAYIFGCGNCHPMDWAKHNNGTVDMELYNPLAAADSIKGLNPSSAAYVPGNIVLTDTRGISYTDGMCNNIYCHSHNERTSEVIPQNDPDWQSKVAVARKYMSITWGSGPLNCSGCHGNPTQTAYPTNDGGAGDSHSWIDPYGYQNLHTWNMGYAPISCSYCHNDTVTQLNTYTEDALGVRTLSDVPIANFANHVNGRKNVAFDRRNAFVYSTYGSGNIAMSLLNATYDPVTKNCSNVSCHIQQTTVTWGTPYRWYNTIECDRCHGMTN